MGHLFALVVGLVGCACVVAGLVAHEDRSRAARLTWQESAEYAPQVARATSLEEARATLRHSTVAGWAAEKSVPDVRISKVVIDPAGTMAFSGSAKADTTIVLRSDGRIVGRTRADSAGRWTVHVERLFPAGDHGVEASSDARRGGDGAALVNIFIPEDFRDQTRPLVVETPERAKPAGNEEAARAQRRAAEDLARAANEAFTAWQREEARRVHEQESVMEPPPAREGAERPEDLPSSERDFNTAAAPPDDALRSEVEERARMDRERAIFEQELKAKRDVEARRAAEADHLRREAEQTRRLEEEEKRRAYRQRRYEEEERLREAEERARMARERAIFEQELRAKRDGEARRAAEADRLRREAEQQQKQREEDERRRLDRQRRYEEEVRLRKDEERARRAREADLVIRAERANRIARLADEAFAVVGQKSGHGSAAEESREPQTARDDEEPVGAPHPDRNPNSRGSSRSSSGEKDEAKETLPERHWNGPLPPPPSARPTVAELRTPVSASVATEGSGRSSLSVPFEAVPSTTGSVAGWRTDPNARCRSRAGHVLARLPGVYTVAYGDTLWDISEAHYGAGQLYGRIYRSNRRVIRHPHWIYPCERLRIPPAP